MSLKINHLLRQGPSAKLFNEHESESSSFQEPILNTSSSPKKYLHILRFRKHYFLFLIAITSLSFSQSDSGKWIKKAYYGGGQRRSATSFCIGETAYVGTGSKSHIDEYTKDFYKYDFKTDVWNVIKPLPYAANGRIGSTGFAINGKGYIVGGEKTVLHKVDSNFSLNDVWEYNPKDNEWYQKTNFPRGIVDGISFSIGDKGYAGLGISCTLNSYIMWEHNETNDFYEYDPLYNKWTRLNDFPGAPRSNAIGFTYNGKGYVGLGYDYQSEKIYFTDFWEYDPTTDSWTRLKDFPGQGRSSAIGYGTNNYCYIGMGEPNDFFRYNIRTKEWEALSYLPGSKRYDGYSFCIDNSIYYGGGMTEGDTAYNTIYSDLWKYTPTDLPTGINLFKSSSVSINPNPVNEGVTVSGINEKSILTVNNLAGEQILSKYLTQNQTYISLKTLFKGIYIVNIKTDKGNIIYKNKIIKN